MADNNEYKIVVWGDSIAGTLPKPWPELMEFMFNACLNTGRLVKVINSGICGMPASRAKKQFHESVAVHAPDMVLIQFGFNDLRYDGSRGNKPLSTPAEFRQHIADMINDCRKVNAAVLVVGNHRPFSFAVMPDGVTYGETAALYNRMAREAAEENSADFIDMSELDIGGMHFRELVADGVHLSEMGKRLYSNTIGSYVCRKLNSV